jgi:frataxin
VNFRKNPLENNVALYHEISNHTLHEILSRCEQLEDMDIPGFDAEEHDGVFELKLGSKGTYVINKQSPNRQIWLSSPISGPKRYNWDASAKQWRNTRDGHLLYDLFCQELSKLLDIEFKLP